MREFQILARQSQDFSVICRRYGLSKERAQAALEMAGVFSKLVDRFDGVRVLVLKKYGGKEAQRALAQAAAQCMDAWAVEEAFKSYLGERLETGEKHKPLNLRGKKNVARQICAHIKQCVLTKAVLAEADFWVLPMLQTVGYEFRGPERTLFWHKNCPQDRVAELKGKISPHYTVLLHVCNAVGAAGKKTKAEKEAERMRQKGYKRIDHAASALGHKKSEFVSLIKSGLIYIEGGIVKPEGFDVECILMSEHKRLLFERKMSKLERSENHETIL